MTNEFTLMLQACGLSHQQASDYFKVRLDTVKAWVRGKDAPPKRVMEELDHIFRTIEAVITEALGQIDKMAEEKGMPEEIEIGYCTDDAEANSLGFPYKSVHDTVISHILATGRGDGFKFKIVPRGSTLATAGATDAHGK